MTDVAEEISRAMMAGFRRKLTPVEIKTQRDRTLAVAVVAEPFSGSIEQFAAMMRDLDGHLNANLVASSD